MKIKMFLILGFSVGLASCGGAPKKPISESTPILIETKAQLRSKNEKNNVKIEIVLAPSRAIRMEVTGTLGYRVATVVMTPQKIQYALHTNSTFFEGPFSAQSLYPIFNQLIDPRILWKVIHGQNPQSSSLACQLDSEGRPMSCQGLQNLTVQWTYEEPPQKKIVIKNPQFEMIWIFKDQSVFAGSQTETFVLEKPSAYKEIILK